MEEVTVDKEFLRRVKRLIGRHVYYVGNSDRKNMMSYDPEYLKVFFELEDKIEGSSLNLEPVAHDLARAVIADIAPHELALLEATIVEVYQHDSTL